MAISMFEKLQATCKGVSNYKFNIKGLNPLFKICNIMSLFYEYWAKMWSKLSFYSEKVIDSIILMSI